MNEGLIPNRYAKALYKYAEGSGATKQVYEQMKQLSESFVNAKALQTAVENPYLHVADKETVLLTASGAQKGSCVDKFILMIIKNNRVNYVRSMAIAYQDIYRKNNLISKVEISTSGELSELEISKIKQLVEKYESGKTLEFSHNVDTNLIGGFTVKIDSKMLDASIKNELKKLRLKLLS
ncbi:MAG: ATP synthase F1 subunit delta [Muribaculaceae bacterium]|nr:ATP synthase F1 subunit delta [Muribaculaceae bacterium]